jgi:IS5 family transposase
LSKQFSKIRMRFYKDPQRKLGEVNISEVILDKKNQDDIPRALRGLQTLHNDKEAREEVMQILTKEVLPKIDKKVGRKGMDIWNIFVLATLRLGANIDFCRLTDYANSHREVRVFLGFSLMVWDEKYNLQTIKNNLPFITEEIMAKINTIVVKLGHEQFTESKTKELKAKGDSFVMKTKVEYPTDIGLLEDSLVGAIMEISEIANSYYLNGYRQSISTINKIKKLRFRAQLSRKFRCKDDKEKYLEKVGKPHRKLMNFAAKNIRKVANDIKAVAKKVAEEKEVLAQKVNGVVKIKQEKRIIRIELKIIKINYFIAEAEKQINQMERRIFNGEIIPHNEKTFSVYKPYTEWINKGKAGVPVELGVKVCIMEDQFGFILNHRVMYKETDDKIAVEFLKSTQELFPNINSISYDRGFWSKANLEAIKTLVPYVGMPKKGKLSKDDKERQNSENYIIAKEKHSAIESAINALQQHGCDFCPDYSQDSFERYTSTAIVSRNLIKLGDVILQNEQKKLCRKRYTFKSHITSKAA